MLHLLFSQRTYRNPCAVIWSSFSSGFFVSTILPYQFLLPQQPQTLISFHSAVPPCCLISRFLHDSLEMLPGVIIWSCTLISLSSGRSLVLLLAQCLEAVTLHIFSQLLYHGQQQKSGLIFDNFQCEQMEYNCFSASSQPVYTVSRSYFYSVYPLNVAVVGWVLQQTRNHCGYHLPQYVQVSRPFPLSFLVSPCF